MFSQWFNVYVYTKYSRSKTLLSIFADRLVVLQLMLQITRKALESSALLRSVKNRIYVVSNCVRLLYSIDHI